MAKPYAWEDGAVLEDHSRRKHKVLREYLTDYLIVRCQHPKQERFRIAIIDGFCGAGRYGCGAPGSPVIFLETLRDTTHTINLNRSIQGIRPIQIDVLLILNDSKPGVINLCRTNTAPLLAEIRQSDANLSVETQFLCEEFEAAYPTIKHLIESRGFNSSVLFNLDQCGHSRVDLATISNILSTYPAPEILLTFAIQALITFLPKTDRDELGRRLQRFGIPFTSIDDLDDCMSSQAWLGAAERTVFDVFRGFGVYTSPFSINNPGGYRYWLIHFAKSYRARQVYNDILHRNSSAQAHFGRSGLNMLSYDPSQEGLLYLFEAADRKRATEQLYNDIPKAIANFGDAIEVGEFYQSIYNQTPSHSDDIHEAIIRSPDIGVITPNGGERRVANTIRTSDILKLNPQRSFFSVLFPEQSGKE